MSNALRQLFSILLVVAPVGAFAQVISSSDFSTSQGATFVTSGAIGTSPWTVSRSGADWGARIDGGILELTNDASVTANADGFVAVTQPLSSSGFFDRTLSGSDGVVTWQFNMRQIRTDPAGFGAVTSYGVAFVLGGTSASFQNTGSGYAIVLGQTGATDPIRLVRYATGLQGTLTNILTASSALSDVGNQHLSLRVTYNPVGNSWGLFGRSDGTSFADPATGTMDSLVASAVDSTHTSTALTHMGAYWQGSTGATQTAFFDNVTLSAIPEPSTTAAFAGGFCLLLVAAGRSVRCRCFLRSLGGRSGC